MENATIQTSAPDPASAANTPLAETPSVPTHAHVRRDSPDTMAPVSISTNVPETHAVPTPPVATPLDPTSADVAQDSTEAEADVLTSTNVATPETRSAESTSARTHLVHTDASVTLDTLLETENVSILTSV